jgi:hypothetical protein
MGDIGLMAFGDEGGDNMRAVDKIRLSEDTKFILSGEDQNEN